MCSGIHSPAAESGILHLQKHSTCYSTIINQWGGTTSLSFQPLASRCGIRPLSFGIPDVCTRMEDGICIAALFRCLARHLFDHRELNADLGVVDRAFAVGNKWRAQRYGTKASFVERDSTAARTMSEIVDALLDRLHADAEALDCVREISHARTILARGSSAQQQVRVYSQARIAGRSRPKALKDVVDFLLATTVELDDDAAIVQSNGPIAAD